MRAAEVLVDRPLGVLGDLQGPKFRLGEFLGGRIEVKAGDRLKLDLDPLPGNSSRVCVPHPEILAALKPGVLVLVDDGKVRLRVETADKTSAMTVVEAGDELSDHKGLGVPGVRIPMPALTEKDRKDLAFALRLGVDWIALSFVQHPQDMAELRRLVDGRAAVMAKIEKPSALDHLDEILDLSDGLMVARVGLGEWVMESSIWVATTTGVPRDRAARTRLRWTMGTSSGGSSTPRSPRATIRPSDRSRISSR